MGIHVVVNEYSGGRVDEWRAHQRPEALLDVATRRSTELPLLGSVDRVDDTVFNTKQVHVLMTELHLMGGLAERAEWDEAWWELFRLLDLFPILQKRQVLRRLVFVGD